MYLPENKDICELRQHGYDQLIPCIVEIEYQNDYCWLIRYKDSEQCNMVLKSDKRYFFKEVD